MTDLLSLELWFGTMLMFAVILGFEIVHALMSKHAPTLKSSAIWSVVYLLAALAWAGVVYAVWDKARAVEYIAGYVTERALSIDNLFVFILIMGAFAVPRQLQAMVMISGVAIAIVLRAVFIAMGAAIIERFSWVFYIFGVFLLITAWKLLTSANTPADDEYSENAFIRMVRRIVPVTDSWQGAQPIVRHHGTIMLTPIALVMLAIGSTDLLFAFDSIPAIFGLTREPYIVFSANAWALMGMVQLYFLLGGLLERLVYLSYGLAFILALIGVKLVIHAMHGNALPFINGGKPITVLPEIGTVTSLLLIVAALSVSAWFSLRATRNATSTT